MCTYARNVLGRTDVRHVTTHHSLNPQHVCLKLMTSYKGLVQCQLCDLGDLKYVEETSPLAMTGLVQVSRNNHFRTLAVTFGHLQLQLDINTIGH
jgi:hypothetical protein